jgi:hypothetical protein
MKTENAGMGLVLFVVVLILMLVGEWRGCVESCRPRPDGVVVCK